MYEIDQTQNEIRSSTGRVPTCVRPPYDDWNATVLTQIAARGLSTMSYSIDPRDWSLPGTESIVASVVGAAFPGSGGRYARRWRKPLRDGSGVTADH
jgi:peptidoglycan/xylan/chitin deacetylase (PgdA/CDA1 family)